MNTFRPAANELSTLDRVRQAWAEALDVKTVPDDVSFFTAGGDSLLLIVLLERLNEMTDQDLEAADLFQHNTVLAQVALIDEPAAEHTLAELGATNRQALLGRARRAGQGK